MKSKYFSFLIRLWTSENDHNTSWHISLESPGSGEKRYFANLDYLMTYFENLMRKYSISNGDSECNLSHQSSFDLEK